MLIRVIELEGRKWFKLEMKEPTRFVLGSFISVKEKLADVDKMVKKLEAIGWSCAYSKDAELLLCRPNLRVE